MRYIFIINPTAGAIDITEKAKEIVNNFFENRNELHYKIYVTSYRGETIDIVKKEAFSGEKLRVFGFGGDGTLSELVSAAKIYKNVEIGIFPTGSGNDYIKSYGTHSDFINFENQVFGDSIEVDTIESNEGTFINICSMGLDAKVGYGMNKFKGKPFINGAMCYNLALASALLQKIGDNVSVKIHSKDGIKEYKDNFLFILAASGKAYGGGYYGAPKAVTNDGLLDFVLIKTPPYRKLLSLINVYKKGEHIENSKFKDYLIYCTGTKIEVETEKAIFCSCDGECTQTTNNTFKIGEYKVNFILPKNLV
ncbi:MAG: diacylglycerol kinase family protein [Clostridia bacterium]